MKFSICFTNSEGKKKFSRPFNNQVSAEIATFAYPTKTMPHVIPMDDISARLLEEELDQQESEATYVAPDGSC